MKKIFLCLYLLFYLPVFSVESGDIKQEKLKHVALCIMATGRYDKLASELIASARENFCKTCDVTYFVFTDGEVTPAKDVVRIQQARLGWPHDTLKRFEVYDKYRDLFSEMDYIFALDADMLFVSEVGEEILSDLVATEHPGHVGKRGTYERHHKSTAYVSKKEGDKYFAGGFYGGSRVEFLKLIKHLKGQILKDEKIGFIAKWHDESHLNRYFIDNKPTKILSPSYCYPERWKIPYEKKILALNKNHKEMRS